MENKQARINETELIREFIPRLKDLAVWADIAALTVPETILLLNNVIERRNTLIASRHFNADQIDKAVRRLRELIPKQILILKELFTIIDENTNLPFLDEEGRVFLFSNESFALECLDYYRQQLRMWQLLTIKHDDIKSFLEIEFCYNGARGAVIDNGQNYYIAEAAAFIPLPNLQAVPLSEQPVMNPDYLRALTMLQQERLWKCDYPGKRELFDKYEDEMIHTFAKARFLVPVKISGQDSLPAPKMSGTFTLNPGQTISFPALKAADGREATPIFTDWYHMGQYYDKEEWGGWVLYPEDLLTLPTEMAVLNVASIAFGLPKNFVSNVLELSKNLDHQ